MKTILEPFRIEVVGPIRSLFGCRTRGTLRCTATGSCWIRRSNGSCARRSGASAAGTRREGAFPAVGDGGARLAST